MQRDSMVDEI